MKKITLILAILFSLKIFASDNNVMPWSMQIVSAENNVNSNHSVTLEFILRFLDTAFFDYSLSLRKHIYYCEVATQNQGGSNSWWNQSNKIKPDTGLYLAKDSIEGSISFSYNPSSLPYSCQTVFLDIKDSSDNLISQTMFDVYFTTYGSVEVWNEYDFELLKRSWDSPEQGLQTSYRINLYYDSIPESNVSDSDFNNDSVMN